MPVKRWDRERQLLYCFGSTACLGLGPVTRRMRLPMVPWEKWTGAVDCNHARSMTSQMRGVVCDGSSLAIGTRASALLLPTKLHMLVACWQLGHKAGKGSHQDAEVYRDVHE